MQDPRNLALVWASEVLREQKEAMGADPYPYGLEPNHKALEAVVRNRAERPRVRGEAAEALAHSHRRESHDVLIAGLRDSSKDVRFWCAFALGEMAESRALPHLERLVSTDKRPVKGFHSVAKEAADAIENIHIGNVPHRRKDGCIFCVKA